MRVDNTGIQCDCPAFGPCSCPDTYESQCVTRNPGNCSVLYFWFKIRQNDNGPLKTC